MKAGSLRARLLLAAVIWILGALLAVGLALLFLFTASFERGVLEDLEAARTRIIAEISPGNQQPVPADALPDPRYGTPFSGLYWQVEDLDTGQLVRSRSLWDESIEVTADGASLQTSEGPEGQRLAVVSNSVSMDWPEGERTYRVIAAQDRADIDRSIRQFTNDLVLSLAIVGVALIAAAYLLIELGLSPLRTVTTHLERIRRGRADRLEGQFPEEVRPLVQEVNDLLTAREESIASARTRAADLAHGLKTPISVIATTANKLKVQGDTGNAATLERLAMEMGERVDYQLRLVRLRPRAGTRVHQTSLNDALLRTLSVMRKTMEGERLHWHCELGHDAEVDLDGHDLLELVGIILENAAKWASTRVEINVALHHDRVEVTVVDDGPGLDLKQLGRLGQRGERLDSRRPGSGLGLAIASEILAINDGKIAFEKSDRGGLCVKLTLPTAVA